jgi:hypothetical protein
VVLYKLQISFVTIVNRITLLISFSDNLLLADRNVTGVCTMILHPVILLIPLLILTAFLVEPLEFSAYRIMSWANSKHFSSSFTMWIPLIYFSCLISLAKLSVLCGREVVKMGILAFF